MKRSCVRMFAAFAVMLSMAAVAGAYEKVIMDKPVTALMPAGADMVVRFRDGTGFCKAIAESEFVKALRKTAFWEMVKKNVKFTNKIVVAKDDADKEIDIEKVFGMSWKQAAEAVFGRDVAGAAYLDEKSDQPLVLLVGRATDAEKLTDLAARLRGLAEKRGVKLDEFEHAGLKIIGRPDDGHLAIAGEFFAFSNSKPLLLKAAELAAGKVEKSMAKDAAYRKAIGQLAADSYVTIYLRPEAMVKMIGWQRRGMMRVHSAAPTPPVAPTPPSSGTEATAAGGNLMDAPVLKKSTKPSPKVLQHMRNRRKLMRAQMLPIQMLQGILGSFESVAVGVRLEERTVVIDKVATLKESGVHPLIKAGIGSGGELRALKLVGANTIAVSDCRIDVGALYKWARAEILKARPKMAQMLAGYEMMMTAASGGQKSMADMFSSSIGPEFALLVTRLDAKAEQGALKLPGLALLAEVNADPKTAATVATGMQGGMNMAVGMINGGLGGQQLSCKSEKYHGTTIHSVKGLAGIMTPKVHTANSSTDPAAPKPPMANVFKALQLDKAAIELSVAVVGRFMVIASHPQVIHDLVDRTLANDRLHGGPTDLLDRVAEGTLPGKRTSVTVLDIANLVKLLKDNRPLIVEHVPDGAAKGFDAAIEVLSLLRGVAGCDAVDGRLLRQRVRVIGSRPRTP